MTTFDETLPIITEILKRHKAELSNMDWLLVNRDLKGKVRLIAPAAVSEDKLSRTLKGIAEELESRLGDRAYPAKYAILYDENDKDACKGASLFPLEGFDKIKVADRLPVSGNWLSIASEDSGAPIVVFFSVKGGVGRYTAIAASALSLAQNGKKVLVLDMDLASPGLSSALLPENRRPKYGIVDWLIEDLVGNGDSILDKMYAKSDIIRDEEVFVVPAHGREPGEYVSKLGRAWMSVVRDDGTRESWPQRLRRMVDELKKALDPEIVLIDSRSGIDDLASACVTDLGAKLILLFAFDDDQTWTGHQILFRHWRHASVAKEIRERLQLVAAMMPETDTLERLGEMREAGYELFAAELYDAIPPGEMIGERWNFEESDDLAPHAPWLIRRHQGFTSLKTLRGRLSKIEESTVVHVFGPLIQGLGELIEEQDSDG
ncbi:MAG: AAA family ATPase [Synergistota bacterium]|nr:AAA family ATPase [Synergistota bacterium]